MTFTEQQHKVYFTASLLSKGEISFIYGYNTLNKTLKAVRGDALWQGFIIGLIVMGTILTILA